MQKADSPIPRVREKAPIPAYSLLLPLGIGTNAEAETGDNLRGDAQQKENPPILPPHGQIDRGQQAPVQGGDDIQIGFALPPHRIHHQQHGQRNGKRVYKGLSLIHI